MWLWDWWQEEGVYAQYRWNCGMPNIACETWLLALPVQMLKRQRVCETARGWLKTRQTALSFGWIQHCTWHAASSRGVYGDFQDLFPWCVQVMAARMQTQRPVCMTSLMFFFFLLFKFWSIFEHKCKCWSQWTSQYLLIRFNSHQHYFKVIEF